MKPVIAWLIPAPVCGIILLALFGGLAWAGEKFALTEIPNKARFPLPMEREWPSMPGEAVVCLWEDDKLAALSLTVDDNCAMDVPWWVEQSEKYRIKPTWFLITKRIYEGQASNGTWKMWADLQAKGYGIECHTAEHLHTEKPGWAGIEWEYSEGIRDIEANIPGYKVRCLAYPGGANGHLNDRAIASKYFISARSTTGGGSRANQIDYLGTRILSAAKPVDVESLLDPKSKIYRGWGITLCHFMGGPGDYKAKFPALLEVYKNHEEDLWGGLYRDVAMYGQERDTAHLQVLENTPAKIRLSLSDQMDGTIYNYPLTVKVRLAEAWKGAKATQAGREIPCRSVEKNGACFSLLKITPDRGEVVLTPSDTRR